MLRRSSSSLPRERLFNKSTVWLRGAPLCRSSITSYVSPYVLLYRSIFERHHDVRPSRRFEVFHLLLSSPSLYCFARSSLLDFINFRGNFADQGKCSPPTSKTRAGGVLAALDHGHSLSTTKHFFNSTKSSIQILTAPGVQAILCRFWRLKLVRFRNHIREFFPPSCVKLTHSPFRPSHRPVAKSFCFSGLMSLNSFCSACMVELNLSVYYTFLRSLHSYRLRASRQRPDRGKV